MEGIILYQDRGNKMKRAIMFILMVLVTIGSASAYAEATYRFNTDNVKAEAVDCLNAECSQTAPFSGTFPNGKETTNGQIVVRTPTDIPDGVMNYALFFVSDGYLPKAGKSTANTDIDYGIVDLTFHKKDVCRSVIDTFKLTNTVEANMPLIINVQTALSAETQSAFELSDLPIAYVPEEFKDRYYSVDTLVTLEIFETDSNGNPTNSVYTDVEPLTEQSGRPVYAGSSESVQFTWTTSNAGDYVAVVSTEVIDDQCVAYEPLSSGQNFEVYASRPENECYTKIDALKTTDPMPRTGDNVEVTFTKISNYVDGNGDVEALPSTISYTVEEVDEGGNSLGTFTAEGDQPLQANSNAQYPETYGFSFKTDEPGFYKITVTGVCDSSRCDGFENKGNSAYDIVYVYDSDAKYIVEFQVKDGHTGNALPGAEVDFGGTDAKTDSNGKAAFEVTKGSYEYLITANGYLPREDVVEVTNYDREIVVMMAKDNHAPQVRLPNTIIEIESNSDNPGLLDLTEYVEDDEEIEAELLYEITGNQNLVIDQNDLDDGILSVSVGDWTGDEVLTITVTDKEGQSGADTITIRVVDGDDGDDGNNGGIIPKIIEFIREHIFVSSIKIENGYDLLPGDAVHSRVYFSNDGDKDFENVKVVASIPELGIRGSRGPYDLSEDEEESGRVFFELPEDVEPGYYYVRYAVGHGSEKRIKYREIFVEGDLTAAKTDDGVKVVYCQDGGC